MRRLWGRMAALYGGARWASAASALPETGEGELTLAARTWADALAGVSDEQIGDGLRACLAAVDEYVPTPALFRARCLGVPSIAAVRLMMRVSDGFAQSRFMLLVRRYIDHCAFHHASSERAERMLRDAYETAVEFVMRGGELPPLPVAEIAAPKPAKRTPASAETIARSMAEMRIAIGEWPRS